MNRLFLLFSVIILASITGLNSQRAPNWLWAKRGGSLGNDYAYSTATDSQGNQYIAGAFEGNASFGSYTLLSDGQTDVFIAKLDSAGNWLWAKRAGGDSFDYGLAVTVDPWGGVFVTGSFQGTAYFGATTLTSSGNADVFAAKLNSAGDWIWVSRGGGINNCYAHGYAITADQYGTIIVTGYYSGGHIGFGSIGLGSTASYEIFVAKLDDSGGWLWAVQGTGNSVDVGYGIAVDADSNIYVTGYFAGTSVFGSTTLISGGGTYDILAAKLDSAGNWLWAKKAGGSAGADYGYALDLDSYANVYLTGNFSATADFGSTTLISSGNSDVYAARLDTDGNWLWAVRAGGTGTDNGKGIAVKNSGTVYLAGEFNGTADFGSTSLYTSSGSAIYVAKLSAGGNWLWAVRAEGYLDDVAYDVEMVDENHICLTGYFKGSCYFGYTSLTSAGLFDVFAARLEDLIYDPLPPENLVISRSGSDILLEWDPVIEDTNGQPIIPDHYNIYFCDYDPEGMYFPQGETAGTSWIHVNAALQPKGFYMITAELAGR